MRAQSCKVQQLVIEIISAFCIVAYVLIETVVGVLDLPVREGQRPHLLGLYQKRTVFPSVRLGLGAKRQFRQVIYRRK